MPQAISSASASKAVSENIAKRSDHTAPSVWSIASSQGKSVALNGAGLMLRLERSRPLNWSMKLSYMGCLLIAGTRRGGTIASALSAGARSEPGEGARRTAQRETCGPRLARATRADGPQVAARHDRPKGLSRRTGMRQDQDPLSQVDRERSKIASPFENRPTRRSSPNRSMNFPDTWASQCRALAVLGM